MKIDLGLRGQLALAFGILVGASVAASAVSEYMLARSAMLERLEKRELPLLLDSTVQRVENQIARPVEIARSVADNAYILDFVNRGEDPSTLPEMASYLARVKDYSHAVSSFVVSNRSLQYYTGAGHIRTLSRDRPRDQWFFDFLRSGDVCDLSFDVDESSGVPTVFVNYALGGSPGRQLGLAGVGVELSGLVELVRDVRDGRRSRVYLVDRSGLVQVHPDARAVHTRLHREPRLESLVLRGGDRIHSYERRGERLFVGARLIRDADWFAVVEMSQDEVLAPLRKTLTNSLLLAFLVGIVSTTLGLLLGRRMAGQLLDRAEQAELIDHMGQALVVFDREGRVFGESSRRAHELFGKERLASATIHEVLFPNAAPYDLEAAAFRDFLPLAFQTPPERWDGIAELAPSELVLRAGRPDQANLTLEFRPIVEDHRAVRVMLLATDVTAERRLEQMRLAEQSQHERELASMRQLVGGGADNFLAFLRGTDERLAAIEAGIAESVASLSPSDVETMFRLAHTIRGEARSFAQDHLEAAVTTLENRLVEFRADARRDGTVELAPHRGLMHAELLLARGELERSRDTFVEASPLGRAALDRTSVSRSDVERLTALVSRVGALAEGGAAIRELVSRLGSRPFGELTQVFLDTVPRWAESAGKRGVLEVHGKDTPIPSELTPALRTALVHLVRNAIAHGIERPSERAAAGKNRIGRIVASAENRDGHLEIVVEDDGAGIDFDALRTSAAERGVTSSDEAVEELLFAAGVSTAEDGDALAGRGVGLCAVREELADAGYSLAVESRTGRGARFVIAKRSSGGAVSNAAE